MSSEFSLIDRYFTRPTRQTVLGVGDDGAVVQASAGMELVISTDMLVAGTHYLPDTDPTDLGWKCLAVNLSDMAAMGAVPRWALLALALPSADEAWLAAFSTGFFDCAEQFSVDIIGGDTTRGPGNLCVTILGEAASGQDFRRSGAQMADDIWVSGYPGRAALGLAQLQGRCQLPEPLRADCLAALHRPQPRVALGLCLRGIANAAIDISDGLLADLGHILEQSRVRADLQLTDLPVDALARECWLAGGDDYELLFTAATPQRPAIIELSRQLNLPLTRIGQIIPATAENPAGEIGITDGAGQAIRPSRRGYDHFQAQG